MSWYNRYNNNGRFQRPNGPGQNYRTTPRIDTDSETSEERRRINNLHANFMRQTWGRQNEDHQQEDDFQNDRDNNPREETVMSLTDQMNALKIDLAANPPRAERLSMLPQQQQQVKNLKDNLGIANTDLESRSLYIDLFESINNKLNLGLNQKLQQTKTLHLQQLRKLEEDKLCLQKADFLASKFTAALEMPIFTIPPLNYKREQSLLDKKNIVRMITAYDDTDTKSTRTFKLVWSEILNFGRGEYLNEEEYKTILSVILRGNIAEDFRLMDKEKKSLREIVDELCVLYDTTQTLDDYQHEVDNFKREKNENLKRAMARANKLIRRLEPLSAEAAWPETYNNMRKSILRQIVGANTRAHIDLEESRLVKAGASYDVESLIKMAHEYETHHNAIPTKDVPTVYQVASLAPKKSSTEISKTEDQLNYLKSEMSQNKNWEQKLDEVIELATNAAHYKRDRSQSADNREKKFGSKPQKSEYRPPQKKAFKDEDIQMKEINEVRKENRADKPSQERGRTSEKKEYYPKSRDSSQNTQNRSQSSGPYRDRSKSENRGQTPAYQRNNYQGGPKKEGSYNSKNWMGPKLIVHGDKHYYACVPCNAMHEGEVVCYKYYEAKN